MAGLHLWLRVWNEVRSIEELERWQYSIIPTHETIDTTFNLSLYTETPISALEAAFLRRMYLYGDVLRVYYRFDDAGNFAEDYTHFLDRDYYLDINKAFDEDEFAKVDGFCHKGGVICISEAIDISPGNLDSSLCFFQPSVSHDVLCI